MASLSFDDIFVVKNIDPDGKKFERVSRIFCDSGRERWNSGLCTFD